MPTAYLRLCVTVYVIIYLFVSAWNVADFLLKKIKYFKNFLRYYLSWQVFGALLR